MVGADGGTLIKEVRRCRRREEKEREKMREREREREGERERKGVSPSLALARFTLSGTHSRPRLVSSHRGTDAHP